MSGCANPCGGEGRVGNRPLGGEGPEQALGGSGGWDSRSGLGVGMEGLGVHRGLRLELGHSKASAPAPEDRGPHSRRDPRSGRPRKQMSTEAQPFRGRVGERSHARLQWLRPASAPQGSGRSLCSWWQVSGAGSPAWAAFRKGFREGLCLLRVQGRSSWSGSRGRRPPCMGVG